MPALLGINPSLPRVGDELGEKNFKYLISDPAKCGIRFGDKESIIKFSHFMNTFLKRESLRKAFSCKVEGQIKFDSDII